MNIDCFRITPAPYEKAQASEEIRKSAAHPGSKLNQKKCCVGRACVYSMLVRMYVGAALPPLGPNKE